MPFIKSTTGAEATALSIAAFVSVDRKRERTAMGVNLEAKAAGAGRVTWRNAYVRSQF